ncbi:TlpA family protein disulfide reductase [Spongiivirga citrea]|uniref:Redoxin domain-containing protein n=1 Tax=Spongiivirga citrea TaxID=1481457 RepID=A0A6M0CJL2_9FLAO|nr:TlpA disulfide reductase family protein [Spongiivirga citrea]NER18116.1 redoxin domain-containing protein [Spongiivirga citrea]
MKNLCLFILSSILLIGCSENKSVDYALFSGNVTGDGVKEVVVKGPHFEKSIPLNSDGTFADTLKIDSKGYYEYYIGQERSEIYFDKGDDIRLTIDLNEFDESIKYSGEGSERNNFLAEKYMLNERSKGDEASLFSLQPEAYKSKIGKINDDILALLNTKKVSPDFKALEKENIRFSGLSSLVEYGPAHNYFTKGEGAAIPENFLADVNALDLYNDDNYRNFSSYRNIVALSLSNKMGEIAETNGGNYNAAFMQVANDIPKGYVKDEYLNLLAFAMLSPSSELDEMYKMFMENTSNQTYKDEYKTKYEKLTALSSGRPSPTFDYENHKGGKTALTDLKGKYVYIDVWATWCAPCIAEIPSLKKLEAQYHNKNIEFVSISVDRKNAYDKWKQMVIDKDLGGIQLYADNAFQSEFITGYSIDAIPRFILIDPEGKIVNADAPRPSSPSLTTLFDELKI